jgi:hypothetical protein
LFLFNRKSSQKPNLAQAREGERLKLCCTELVTVFANVLKSHTQLTTQKTDTPLLGYYDLSMWPVFPAQSQPEPNLAHAKGGEKVHACVF